MGILFSSDFLFYLAFILLWFNLVVPCRLYIKQPPSSTLISGYEEEPEWAEYKIKETNMFTVDKYQQVNAFETLRIQTVSSFFTLFKISLHLSFYDFVVFS